MTMDAWLFIVSLFVFSVPVKCLTNAEFYDLVRAYALEEGSFEPIDDDDDDVMDTEVDVVIDLPGEPDDEIDITYLLEKIGFTSALTPDSDQILGRHHHHHHHRWHHKIWHKIHHHIWHHHHSKAHSWCRCHRLGCDCCVSKRFKIRAVFKKFKFSLNACIGVTYLPSNKGFRVYFKVNGRQLFSKEISLRHPPALCYGIPGLKRFAKVCLEFYNINLRTKQICARLTGKLDLKIKTFKVHLKIGCFRIPLADEDALLSLPGDTDLLSDDDQASVDLTFLQKKETVSDDEETDEDNLADDMGDFVQPLTAMNEDISNLEDSDEEQDVDNMRLHDFLNLQKQIFGKDMQVSEDKEETISNAESSKDEPDGETLRFESNEKTNDAETVCSMSHEDAVDAETWRPESKDVDMDAETWRLESKDVDMDAETWRLESKDVDIDADTWRLESKDVDIDAETWRLESKDVDMDADTLRFE